MSAQCKSVKKLINSFADCWLALKIITYNIVIKDATIFDETPLDIQKSTLTFKKGQGLI